MFWVFFIANQLGKYAKQVLSEMSTDELLYWIEFYKINPSTADRVDMATGIISATIASGLSDGKTEYKPIDFIPQYIPQAKLSAQELKDKARKAFPKRKSK